MQLDEPLQNGAGNSHNTQQLGARVTLAVPFGLNFGTTAMLLQATNAMELNTACTSV